VARPAMQNAAEVDVEHDAAEIEQQGIGIAGRKKPLAHPYQYR